MTPEYHCCIGGRNGTANAATSACPATRRQNRKRRNQSTVAYMERRDLRTVASQRAVREARPHPSPLRSRLRYWIASLTWFGARAAALSRSAIVRAILRDRKSVV